MSASTASQTFCPICKEIKYSSDDWVAIQGKGINEASLKRKDKLVVDDGTKVHKSCRQQYINDKNIKSHVVKKSSDSVTKRTTRQSSGGFDSEKDCVFCGCTIDLDKGHFSMV